MTAETVCVTTYDSVDSMEQDDRRIDSVCLQNYPMNRTWFEVNLEADNGQSVIKMPITLLQYLFPQMSPYFVVVIYLEI